jgi:hypothetical protein
MDGKPKYHFSKLKLNYTTLANEAKFPLCTSISHQIPLNSNSKPGEGRAKAGIGFDESSGYAIIKLTDISIG